jgi:hypothetical protein
MSGPKRDEPGARGSIPLECNDRGDDLLKALRELPQLELPAEVRERVRLNGRAELDYEARSERWVTFLGRAWMRVGLPAALAVTVVAYLSWAVTSASALYR